MMQNAIPFAAKNTSIYFSSIEEIVEDMGQGKMIILVDDKNRENEGNLIIAAEAINDQAINFMSKHARGLICLTLTASHCHQLELPLMVTHNNSSMSTNFTVSIEAAEGVTTGISTADRARTIQAAIAKNATPSDIVMPGHIFPLMAHTGGVLARAGHTEAGCDLARLAGLHASAVICEIMNDDGSMARLPNLFAFAEKHSLKIGSVADLISYRHAHEQFIHFLDCRKLVTIFGEFQLRRYEDSITGDIHQALIYGDVKSGVNTFVRVHAPFNGMDLLDNDRRGHSWSVTEAMRAICGFGTGILLLMHDDGIGAFKGNTAKELKHYGIGAQILRDIGVSEMTLLTKQRALPAMEGFGLNVKQFLVPEDLNEKSTENSLTAAI